MLAYILAIAVGLGSFTLYMSAFFFPEVYRKYDFIWSGIGFFYALVLWVCAGRITGGVLLGQFASVALLGWLGWQTLQLRRELTPPDRQTLLPGSAKSLDEVLQVRLRGLQTNLKKRLSKKNPPSTQSPPSATVEPERPIAAAQNAASPPEWVEPRVPIAPDEPIAADSPQLAQDTDDDYGFTAEELGDAQLPNASATAATSDISSVEQSSPATSTASAATGWFAAIKTQVQGIFGRKKPPRPIIVREPGLKRRQAEAEAEARKAREAIADTADWDEDFDLEEGFDTPAAETNSPIVDAVEPTDSIAVEEAPSFSETPDSEETVLPDDAGFEDVASDEIAASEEVGSVEIAADSTEANATETADIAEATQLEADLEQAIDSSDIDSFDEERGMGDREGREGEEG